MAALENSRASATSPENLSGHYARLAQVDMEFKVTTPEQIFNIIESGLTTKTSSRVRAKAVIERKKRSDSVELKWSFNSKHVTIMPVVSADGSTSRPIVIVQGKQAKLGNKLNETIETPASFLPYNVLITYRYPGGVDYEFFAYSA